MIPNSLFDLAAPIATLSISPSYLLYFVPLVVSISLVFGGTRHEDHALIIQHAIGTARWITGFMAIIFVVLLFIEWLV
ncbi:hypothetical protein [Novipirellula herctigrandis]|uniref:hypothetical protein n=1 Tax=Novipirellula herctigrandis TaxID=2527986 RepID=UPI003AF34947